MKGTNEIVDYYFSRYVVDSEDEDGKSDIIGAKKRFALESLDEKAPNLKMRRMELNGSRAGERVDMADFICRYAHILSVVQRCVVVFL